MNLPFQCGFFHLLISNSIEDHSRFIIYRLPYQSTHQTEISNFHNNDLKIRQLWTMIKQQIKNALDEYMEQSDENMLCNLYNIVLGEVEKVLLESVMERVNHNQTQAARLLGINRNTLRRKLEKHDLS